MRRVLLLLLLATGASAQTPDEVATAAFAAMLDAPATTFHFFYTVATPDTVVTEEGTVTARVDTLADAPLFRIDQEDGSVAFDGSVYRVLMPRTSRIYVDSTATEMSDGIAGLLMLHPAIGTRLLYIHNNAAFLTDEGGDDIVGAPCRRLAYSATPLDSADTFISVCYDDETHLPSQTRIFRDGDAPVDIEVMFSEYQSIPIPPPETFTFAGTAGYTEVPYTSDEPLLALGAAAPAFALTAADGAPVRLDGFLGRPVLIDFWGTWCPPCVAAIPDMEALHRAYPDLAVLGFAAYEESDPEPLARQHGATYPIFRVPEELAEAYQVHVFPTYYLVGPDGTVRFAVAHTDAAGDTSDAVRSALIALLGPPR